MFKLIWMGFGYGQLEKEFETVGQLIRFMEQDDIKPFIKKAIVNGTEFKRADLF